MKLIQIRGDNGLGCYSGISITILKFIYIPLFWLDFYGNEYSRKHDIACDGLDWASDPDKAFAEYKQITTEFFEACWDSADGDLQEVEACVAYWFASRFGDFKYELLRKR